MKRVYLCFCLALLLTACNKFSDQAFQEFCIKEFDLNGDGRISREEADKVTCIQLSEESVLSLLLQQKPIVSLKGIEIFKNLEEIDCSEMHSLKFVDLRKNKKITKIDDFAFSECSDLYSVYLPSTVKEIGDFSFSECHSLSDLIFPESIVKIGEYAFSECYKLTEIKLSSNLFQLGKGAFEDCKSLKCITIPGSLKIIPESAFVCCSSLSKVTIEEGVTEIHFYAFDECVNLLECSLPASMIKISKISFDENTKIINLDNNNIEYIPLTTKFQGAEEQYSPLPFNISDILGFWHGETEDCNVQELFFAKDYVQKWYDPEQLIKTGELKMAEEYKDKTVTDMEKYKWEIGEFNGRKNSIMITDGEYVYDSYNLENGYLVDYDDSGNIRKRYYQGNY